ncbi:Nucleoporin [Lachnellula willkommii]|uniref:Nucleoporin n=1 Tax=Lachnellula willkommii TaxID=215461 RepID=A0A559MFZ3_9HELO|nr:Nucleoporin [Lachnellula willkommii]
MFSSATTNTPAGSIRTSRRRQRPLSNEGSISQPPPKRQRSALNKETFVPPDGRPHEMTETKTSKPVAALVKQESREISGPQKQIAVRGKKSRSGDRTNKGDGSIVLTANDTYTVSRIISGPEKLLLANTASREHGSIHSDSGYALILSHTHATVWPYSKPPTEFPPYVFDIPHPSKHVSDPLPLGCLVSPSTSSSEPGLVVVIPTSGKITYWESVDSAATMGLRLRQNNIELSIPGMNSGETVIQILNAETAGFVLAFSTGRIAYMNVRDGQGRPTISVQFLRGSSASTGGGIFGSLRNVLSASAYRGDIAAVRADLPRKVGERQVVVATAKGKIQSWDIQRGGHSSLNAEADGRETIVQAIKQAIPSFSELLIETFELLDFAFTTLPTQPSYSQASDGIPLLLLTSLTDRDVSHYFLVSVALLQGGLTINKIRSIKSYTTPVNRNAISKTRLYLPNPAHFAYVVFDRAVAVISMEAQLEEAQYGSPHSQLMTESHLSPQTFEDVVFFRDDVGIEVVGSGMEEPQGLSPHAMGIFKPQGHKPRFPAAVLLVRGKGGGIVRVAAPGYSSRTSAYIQQVTAKSKLEQAVYFGSVKENPISFSVRPELPFPASELSEAALKLSEDILCSRNPHILSVQPNFADNLKQRSVALHDLAQYLRSSGVELDRATRWKLLCDAEKLAAATTVWNLHDARVSAKPKGEKRSLITDIVESIHEDYKTEPVSEEGELDRVRKWFTCDVLKFQIAVPWAWQVIKHTYQDGYKDHAFVVEMLSDANDVVMGVLQTAFAFRIANAELYGLQAEPLEHGVLAAGYEGLPEFWTSTALIEDAVRKQLELAHGLVKEYWNKPQKQGQPSVAVVNKLRNEYPTLVDVGIRSSNERLRYCLAHAQDSPQFQIEADQLSSIQEEAQDRQITSLQDDMALSDKAMALAEKFEILKTLARVTFVELNKAKQHDKDVREKIAHYFGKFGTRWATAFYELQIEIGSMGTLLDDFQEQQKYLTAFLRAKPEYAKNVWSKKIELSIGKLARLAGRSYSQENGILIPDGGRTELAKAHDQLGLIKIQDTVYDYILPSISEAIDENAELQLALEAHRFGDLKHRSTFSKTLEQQMANLIKHTAMDALSLVDLLTLMGDDTSADQNSFTDQQFYLALQATRHGISDKHERTMTQRVIWRRCMLRDPWSVINNTDMKDDEQVSEQSRSTNLYRTFRACLKDRLFESNSSVLPISPLEVVGVYTEELDSRFRGADESRLDQVLRDNQIEDDKFHEHIKKNRLVNWYSSILEQAKEDYAREIAGETEDGKNMNDAKYDLEELEETIARKETGKSDGVVSRAKHPYTPKARTSGGAGAFQSSIKQY